ncbi:hypothetical protein HaLaN_23583 [Haematococcus lacustris]|uniref:Uncharacterized protein n=1 Tax=Haematococcus lacustris TaxID=44745 RepID=A0A6A0A1I2_HAELA|nr:hypothetical protein HaLaN_23583 [Haematococcus lacustris]
MQVGSTLQQPAPQDLPSVSLGSTATNSAAGTTAQGRLSQSFAEEAPGCASNQPPPPLDNGVEDSIDNFLRDRCIICPRYPSDQVKKTTGTDYDENDIEYSFDEEDDEDDIATTVMPVTRSEIASARMEIDKLKKELQEQQAVNSGLRGELRKFTTLASRLTAQLQAGKPAAILTTAAGSSVAADSSPAGAPEGLEPGQCIAVLQECQDSGAAAVTGGVEEELVAELHLPLATASGQQPDTLSTPWLHHQHVQTGILAMAAKVKAKVKAI